MTQSEFARKIGIKRQKVHQYLNGHIPNLETAIKICNKITEIKLKDLC